MKNGEGIPLAEKNYKYGKTLSSVIFGYILAMTLAVFLYGLGSYVFDLSPSGFILITVCFAAVVALLLRQFIVKVFKPLAKVEKAMMILFKGSSEFKVDFDEDNDVYPLSVQLNAMLKNLKNSMDREYTAGILKKQAEINALQSQINPHFLYNVLDSIRGHALIEGVDEIAEMTEALSTLFRYSISSSSNLVTLENELKNIKNYFKIQQYRFNNKFDLDIKIDGDMDEILSYQLPKLTIQPVLENSIYHGLEMKMDKGRIIIRVEVTQDRMIINISDDGIGMDKQQLDKVNEKLSREIDIRRDMSNEKKAGIALSNVNQRIKLLFGEEYGLHVCSTPGIGTDVEIVMPVVKDNEGEYQFIIGEAQ